MLPLKRQGARASNEGVSISVFFTNLDEICDLLAQVVEKEVAGEELAEGIAVRDQQKYDWLLPPELACRNYAVESLDVETAHGLCRQILKSLQMTSIHAWRSGDRLAGRGEGVSSTETPHEC